MPIPNAKLRKISDGLAIPPEQTDNLLIVFGYASLATLGLIYDFDQASPATVKQAVGVGRGAQLVASLLATKDHGPVKFVPIAASVGTNTAVAAAGATPPAPTLTGTPLDDYEGDIRIVQAGARGVATFQVSLDKGRTWGPEITTAATYVIPDTGLTFNFPVHAYTTDHRFTWTSSAPASSNTNVTDAMQFVIENGVDFGWGVVTAAHAGAADSDRATAMAGMFSAIGTKIDLLDAAHKFTGFTMEAPSPVDFSTPAGMAAWRAALQSAAPALTHDSLMIAAGYTRRTNDLDTRQARRPAAWSIAERLSFARISEHLGRVKSGPCRSVLSLEHDEEATGGLDSFRYSTMRKVSGRTGFYITRGRQFASPGSPYSYTHHSRVINHARKIGRNGLLDYLNDDFLANPQTGRLLEDEAQNIDSELTNQMSAALIQSQPRHASSVAARVSRTDDLLGAGNMTGEFSVQPKGYAENVDFTIALTRTTQSAS